MKSKERQAALRTCKFAHPKFPEPSEFRHSIDESLYIHFAQDSGIGPLRTVLGSTADLRPT
ncbi:hypothetical protein CY34DRAFT_812119 [Suillus luteus UH-Slu-Lm8-n1]|uniref:Uncharacterized protein n=1 Tax=Suillus luteus UH-Slu-Lm8-n1 TaxID=930992 RepID=A0A0D0A137_9AGAM|nr:hypothetical protein CY34DRAFT_812119 [Suillus luteus UH-Slu-Lm8-n1]